MRLATLRVVFRAERAGNLPAYLGSTIRGVLGHAMKEMSCNHLEEKCNHCHKRGLCNYALCFCSPGNKGGAVNPFVIYVHTRDKTTWEIGDRCTFDFTVIGNRIEYMEFYIKALYKMEKVGWGSERISFILEHILESKNERLLWSSGKKWMEQINTIQLEEKSIQYQKVKAVLLSFDTPTRMIIDGQLCKKITFYDFIKVIRRRVELLYLAYEEKEYAEEFAELEEMSRNIVVVDEFWKYQDYKRYSMNNKQKQIELPGIEGWMLCEGDITPFLSLIQMGEQIHVGKNATIGLGHYQISYVK